MTTIETERLALQPTRVEFFDGLWTAIESSRAELREWMPWAIERDSRANLEFVIRAAKQWESGNERHFTLFFEGEVCGHCSLDRPDPLHSSYEIGYWMRSDLCGRGLMTEAAAAVVNFGFEELEAHRLELRAGVGNVGSIRVAEKLGFQREGLLRSAGRGAAGYHDLYVFGLLETDIL